MRILTVLSVIALTVLISATINASPRTTTPPNPQLRLHRATFDAMVAQGRALTPELTAPAPGAYAIIQLRGPVTAADRAALEETGVTLLEYLPDYAYLVRGTADQLDAAATLPPVYARVPFTIADKLAPALLRALQRGQDDLGPVRITGWPGNQGTLVRDLGTVAVTSPTTADASLLLALANLESVRWIEPAGRPHLLNDRARSIMSVDSIWQDHSLFGSGQIIAIADSGLDTGNTATLSPDFAGRLVATHALAPEGHWDDNHGHGTHVAGSAVGAGVQSGAEPAQHQYAGSFAGIAPEAGLVIQAFEVLQDGSVVGLDPDYSKLFEQAYLDGARLHSNSWGDLTGPIEDAETAFGGYPYGAQRTDQFLWDHPDMAIFAAAGNSGVDGTPGVFGFCLDGDGVIDLDSLLSPATAKNVITVGASESDRSEGGLGNVPWLAVGTCFWSEPIATDVLANNASGMAAFSSRGPADDGRLKPDLVAPGTNIVSNRSHTAGATALWGAHESNADYVYSGGTSMATPLAAGMGVLVREWLATQGLANPSAAAVKATLLNTTRDIAPGQYGTGATQEIPSHYPNPVAGWGRADLSFVNAPEPYTLWVDDHMTGVTTGQSINYAGHESRPLEVVSSDEPLRIMLAWTDPPASLSAAAQLVNDLDLVLTGPDGTIYYGNGVSGGDRTNNVEGIILNNPPVGQYQVQVHAFNVPVPSQPYALVVAGPLGEAAPIALQHLFLPLVLR
ncbi:MAG TPA: S8 family serine peptidase [Anaerolineae bacterium]